METQFKVGDVVELNSGSPKMTVTSVGSDVPPKEDIWVLWFDNGKEKKAHFPPGALRKSERNEGDR